MTADALGRHFLDLGERVEVELLVPSGVGAVPTGPRVVVGTTATATTNVLVLDTPHGLARIPWSAIAVIRNPPAHPAHQ